jgi:exodeoxyribonuclease-5
MKIKLNDDQASALAQILAAYHASETRHALTGNAGTGKTTLMQAVVAKFLEKGVSICVTAPTHKAVSVLAKKLRDAGLSSIKAMTIHSLLGLKVSPNDEENTTLKRNGPSQVSAYRVVVIDEASMVSSDLFDFIEEDLKQRFVLFVGDPAQLPPVGEVETRCFSVRGKSHLSRIVRQADGNPIIRAAQMIRERQDTTPDWDWTLPAEAGPIGIYRAGDDADASMRDAFLSAEFEHDNDTFRYICYTNARVTQVNTKVRSWIYGPTPTPFVAGERAICRTPILNKAGRLALSVNEEAIIVSVTASELKFVFPAHAPRTSNEKNLDEWSIVLPTWRVRFPDDTSPDDDSDGFFHNRRDEQNEIVVCEIARDPRQYDTIMRRVVAEAKSNRSRWWDYHEFKERLARLQHVYALTAHTSQGSTFANCFIDVADIRKREVWSPKECQQLAYVALTRASQAAIIIGAP